MAEKKVIELEVKNKGFEEFEGKTKSLKAQLRELKEQISRLDEGSLEFKKLTAEAGALQDKIGDINRRVNNLSSDTMKMDAAVGGVQAVSGAFGIAASASALFGDENKKLQESMLKVQAAMTLVTSVQAVANALNKDSALRTFLSSVSYDKLTASLGRSAVGQKILTAGTVVFTAVQKALNFVMASNPIFLVIGAATALVGVYQLLTTNTDDLKNASKRFNDEMERNNKLLDRNNEIANKNAKFKVDLLKAQGAESKVIHEAEMEQLRVEEDGRQKALLEVEFNLKALRIQKKSAKKLDQNDLADDIQKNLEKEKERYNKLKSQDGEYIRAKELLEVSFQKSTEKKQDKKVTTNKATNDKILADAKRLQADLLAIEDAEIARNKAKADKILAQEFELADGITAAQKVIRDSELSETEKAINDVNNKYNRLFDLAEINGTDTTTLLIAQKNEINEIELKAAQESLSIQEQKNATELENHKRLQEAKLNAVSGTLSVISNLAELFAGKSEKQQRKAFKIQKAVSIAQATIDTYKSAVSSYNALAGIVPVGPVLGAIAAAGAITSGLLNVKRIASQQFEGGGATGGGGGVPTIGSSSAQQSTPSFNLVGATNVNQLSGLNNQPMQAFVVSGEVTSMQALDRNRLNNATFG